MSGTVLFKFKNARGDAEQVTFTGFHITAVELKNLIAQKKGLKDAVLELSDPKTKTVYGDEHVFPRGSAVTVRRMPAQAKAARNQAATGANAAQNAAEEVAGPAMATLQAITAAAGPGAVHANDEEGQLAQRKAGQGREDLQIAALVDAQNEAWRAQTDKNILQARAREQQMAMRGRGRGFGTTFRAGRGLGGQPTGFCKFCGKLGEHFSEDCPQKLAPRTDLRHLNLGMGMELPVPEAKQEEHDEVEELEQQQQQEHRKSPPQAFTVHQPPRSPLAQSLQQPSQQPLPQKPVAVMEPGLTYCKDILKGQYKAWLVADLKAAFLGDRPLTPDEGRSRSRSRSRSPHGKVHRSRRGSAEPDRRQHRAEEYRPRSRRRSWSRSPDGSRGRSSRSHRDKASMPTAAPAELADATRGSRQQRQERKQQHEGQPRTRRRSPEPSSSPGGAPGRHDRADAGQAEEAETGANRCSVAGGGGVGVGGSGVESWCCKPPSSFSLPAQISIAKSSAMYKQQKQHIAALIMQPLVSKCNATHMLQAYGAKGAVTALWQILQNTSKQGT
eukprot:gene13445-13571_t